MKKHIIISILIIMVIAILSGLAQARDRAINVHRMQKTVTANAQTITSNITGYWWIETDVKIYINSLGQTPSTNYETLDANSSRDYFPLRTVGSTGMQMQSDTGTANVTIFVLGD